MDLSIIIVNWNSKDCLLKANASVEAETKGIEFEVAVIDGGYFDVCEEMLQQSYPHVLFIQSDKIPGCEGKQRGFQGIARPKPSILSPDTEVEGLAIKTLYEHLASLPNAGSGP